MDCRWHQGARPFLYSLGYAPARSVVAKYFGPDVGKAAGVLGAFSLSGFWHAWSGAGLARAEYVWRVSAGLWSLFILQGFGCLIEKQLLRDVGWRRGWQGRLFAAICWACSTCIPSFCLCLYMCRLISSQIAVFQGDPYYDSRRLSSTIVSFVQFMNL